MLFVSFPKVLDTVERLNDDPNVHGIIVQLPLESKNPIDSSLATNAVSPEKDVDGYAFLYKNLNCGLAERINWDPLWLDLILIFGICYSSPQNSLCEYHIINLLLSTLC